MKTYQIRDTINKVTTMFVRKERKKSIPPRATRALGSGAAVCWREVAPIPPTEYNTVSFNLDLSHRCIPAVKRTMSAGMAETHIRRRPQTA